MFTSGGYGLLPSPVSVCVSRWRSKTQFFLCVAATVLTVCFKRFGYLLLGVESGWLSWMLELVLMVDWFSNGEQWVSDVVVCGEQLLVRGLRRRWVMITSSSLNSKVSFSRFLNKMFSCYAFGLRFLCGFLWWSNIMRVRREGIQMKMRLILRVFLRCCFFSVLESGFTLVQVWGLGVIVNRWFRWSPSGSCHLEQVVQMRFVLFMKKSAAFLLSYSVIRRISASHWLLSFCFLFYWCCVFWVFEGDYGFSLCSRW